MNIYKVTRIKKSTNWDAYIGFVCFAENEEQAKNLNPNIYMISIGDEKLLDSLDSYFSDYSNIYINWEIWNNKYNHFDWVNSPNDLKVIKLGVSDSYKIGITFLSYTTG